MPARARSGGTLISIGLTRGWIYTRREPGRISGSEPFKSWSARIVHPHGLREAWTTDESSLTHNSTVRPISGPPPRAALALAAGWLAVVAALTLRSAPEQAARVAETPWTCLVCGDAGATDVLLNLLLFLPFGLLLRLAGWRLWRSAALLTALTITIEVIQGTLLVGRDAALSDVLTNAGGGIAGWLLLPWLVAAARPTPERARHAATAILAASALVWWGTGTGIRTALSPAGPWYGQPTHHFPGHADFPGRVDAATFDGLEVPNDPLAHVPDDRGALALELTVTRRDDATSPLPSSILRLVDGEGHPQVALTQRREALVLEGRVVASGWRLRTPVWRFDGAGAIPTNTPWRWTWRRERDRLVFASGPVGGAMRERFLPVSVGLGWAFVHPFGVAVSDASIGWTLLWLGGWFALLGWFGGHAGGRAAWGFAVAGLAVLGAAARLTDLPVRADELLAAATSYAMAALAAAAVRRARAHVG